MVIPSIASQSPSRPMCSNSQMLWKSTSGTPMDLLECWQMRLCKDQTHSKTAVNVPRLPTPATIPESGISEAYRKRAILNSAAIAFNSVTIAVQGAAIFRYSGRATIFLCSGRAAVDLLECWRMRPSKDQTHSRTAVYEPIVPQRLPYPSQVYQKRTGNVQIGRAHV